MSTDAATAADRADRLDPALLKLAGIVLPTADRADEALKRARALGYERRDLAALFEVLQRLATERRQAA